MPCPMDVNPESWVRSNFAYICSKYMEKYPPQEAKPVSAKKVKLSKKKRQRLAAANGQKNGPRKAMKSSGNVAISRPVSRVIVRGVDVISDEFLSTYDWRRVRMEALKKYGPKCMCCGATPVTGAVMNVDHIKPRKLFPSLALDVNNLQILCHDCNHGKGNWDQTDWRKQK